MRTKGALGKKPRKEHRINIRVDEWQLDQIKDYAKYCQMSISELMIVGARFYFQSQLEIEDKKFEEMIKNR